MGAAGRNGQLLQVGVRGLLGNVLKLDCGDGHITVNLMKIIELNT